MRTLVKHNRGQGLVEFALVIPILLLLMVGIMEFSRAWMTQNVLTGAAREGARAAAVGGDYREAARQVLYPANIRTANVRLSSFVGGDGITIYDQVTVSYRFPVSVPGFLPGMNAATIPLASTTTMRQEY
jgi:TadE-like protein